MWTRKLLAACGLVLLAPATGLAAAGDFNGDGFDDLAIGVPAEDLGAVTGAGAVSVLLGSATGLTDVGNQLWTQDSAGILDAAETDDQFGDALAVGDFNGDGFADLAVGVHFEDVGAAALAGAVNVLLGSAAGLASGGTQFWSQDSTGVQDTAELNDNFGSF